MRRHLPIIAVFLLIAGMLAFVEARPQFPDPDSFYHAKMALIIRDQGFIHQFPWLQYTTLADRYVDYHLGYHILLIPFVTIFDPLVGMKVAAGVFGLIAFYVLYRVLKWFRTPRPEVFTLLAAMSSTFFHRMSLPRAPSLSVALLLLITGAIIKKKPWMAYAGVFAYVWFYYGWPLLFAVLLAVLVADVVAGRVLKERRTPYVKTILAVLAGIASGLVINPYFPQNILYTARDVFKLAIVNYQSVIPVGTEWYPTTPIGFFSGAVFVCAALIFSLLLFVLAAQQKKDLPTRPHITSVMSWFFLSGGFFILSLKSSRFMEYAVPCVALTAGTLSVFSESFVRERLVPEVRSWFAAIAWRRWLVIPVILAAACFIFSEVLEVLPSKERFTAAQFRPSTNWIQQHVPKGELVFHNAWDYSLTLFYLDDTHRYLVGLDPTYMYSAYPEDYQIWSDLVNGTDADVGKVITHFHSSVIVVDTRMQSDFEKNVQASGLFEEVIADGSVHLYAAK